MAISPITTWSDGEQLTGPDLTAEFQNIYTNALNGASQNEVNVASSTTTALTPNHNLIVLGTQQASTSGTAITFSSIPAGTRKIHVMFVGVSTSGTSNIIIQLGDSGGLENSGYLGAVTTIASATPSTANITTGFGVTNAIAAASVLHGTATITLENASAFTWTHTFVGGLSNAATTHFAGGSKSLSAELTQLAITAVNGTDTFDAGVINISYER